MKSFDGNTYTYNANGIRTSKTIGGVKHEYMLDGTKILRETWGENTLIPLYDNEDNVCGIIYNTFPYYFLKNLQGDVIAITNSKGNVVAQYTYDAWGECTIVSDNTGIIARVNPFRYRGYYYDTEIGLYYLQSRYYDPSVGRFINGDDSIVLSIHIIDISICMVNLYTYCQNNSITLTDYYGFWGSSVYSDWNALVLITEMIAMTVGFVVSTVKLGAKAVSMTYTGVGAILGLLCALGMTWCLALAVLNTVSLIIAITLYIKHKKFRATCIGLFGKGVYIVCKA